MSEVSSETELLLASRALLFDRLRDEEARHQAARSNEMCSGGLGEMLSGRDGAAEMRKGKDKVPARVRSREVGYRNVCFTVFSADESEEPTTFVFAPATPPKRYTKDTAMQAAGEFMAWIQRTAPQASFRLVPQKQPNEFYLIPDASTKEPN